MKLKNSNIGKAQLRREQFNRSQNKSKNMGKKSLSKRIIEERVGGITADNINAELEGFAEAILIDEITATIMFHIKFARDTRPYTFNDDVIVGILDRIKDLQVKFTTGIITAKEHLELLEEIDTQIMERVNNLEQSK